MASNFKVVVILPNAKRANMKVNTNTILLTVLEDVCKKHELNPIEWDLTHHNKVIELANSIRYSGIPNNATLELVQSMKARTESTVTVGLQLESGKRLQNQFLPHQTVWEVLEYWAGKGEAVYPEENTATQAVCIYMRQEIVGEEQLKSKTLRSLGLTQGSAIIRLIHRCPNQLKYQANVSAPLSRVVIPEPAPETIEPKPLPQKMVEKQGYKPDRKQPETEPMDISPPSEESVRTSVSDLSSLSAGDTSRSSESTLASSVSAAQSQESLEPAIKNAERYSTQGAFQLVGPRDALLFHGDDVVVSNPQVLQDEFFDVTVSDVRKMYRDLREKRAQLEESPFQTTSARELEKNTNILRQLHDHPHTVVRIRFGNRFVLQGTFRTADTIGTVETWLKEFLVPDLNFYLFATPPKKVLDKETRLVEEGLVGMAVIYFGSDDSSPDQKVLKSEIYEKVSDPVAVFEFTTTKLRNDRRSSGAPDNDQAQPPSSSGQPHSSQNQPGSSTGSGNGAAFMPRRQPAQPRNPGSQSGNVPKWFKPGK